MSVLTDRQREKAISLAQRDAQSRWDWGDWAVDVCGPVGEHGAHDGSYATLAVAIEEIVHENDVIVMPEAHRLRDYRYAADAIPPTLRTTVPSIEAGRILGQNVKDRRELHQTIEALKNEKGIVTVRAVREHFERASPDGPHVKPYVTERETYEPPMPIDRASQVKMARRLMENPDVAKRVIVAPGKAANVVAQAVSEKNTVERRAREAERAERAEREALPISAYEQRILKRYQDLALELAPNALPYADLGELARERIADALEDIVDNARASAEACRPKYDDSVIEGTARDRLRALPATPAA